MKPEEREEIEDILGAIKIGAFIEEQGEDPGISCTALLPLARFARQQLSLKVDGEKLRRKLIENCIIEWKFNEENNQMREFVADVLEQSVMKCLTTEEKE